MAPIGGTVRSFGHRSPRGAAPQQSTAWLHCVRMCGIVQEIIMVQCIIKGCKSRSDVHSKLQSSVHFHRVPKNPDVRNKWMQIIKNNNVTDSTRICSIHFKKENYYFTPTGLHKLLMNAVPDKNLDLENRDSSGDSSDDNQFLQSFLAKAKQRPPPPIIQKVVPPLQPDCNESESFLQLDSNNADLLSLTDSNEINPVMNEKVTTVKVLGSTIKSNVQVKAKIPKKPIETDLVLGNTRNSVKTPLERKLMLEVKRLQLISKKRLEAVKCLEEQNRRLLTRNNYLQQALDECKKVPEEVNNAVLQDSDFFL